MGAGKQPSDYGLAACWFGGSPVNCCVEDSRRRAADNGVFTGSGCGIPHLIARDGLSIRAEAKALSGNYGLQQEWVWAAAIIAIPLVVLGVLEGARALRRRRYEAIARRSKELRRPAPGSRRGRTG